MRPETLKKPRKDHQTFPPGRFKDLTGARRRRPPQAGGFILELLGAVFARGNEVKSILGGLGAVLLDLGSLLGRLGSLLGGLESLLACLGSILGRLGALFGRSWGILERSLGHLGAVLDRLAAVWGLLGS
jgi:hypothetical protein